MQIVQNLLLNETNKNISFCYSKGEQEWRSGESTPLPPMWLGIDSRTRRNMWVQFLVGSLLCSERLFLCVLRFSPLLKNQHFQILIRSRFQWTNSHYVEVPLQIPILFNDMEMSGPVFYNLAGKLVTIEMNRWFATNL